jgi:formate dehydrogenase major subunit
MAECHPVAFRWVMQAKLKGATVIHADPRFTRTSAMADIYAPIRAGSDIAFLGGLIRYVIENEKYLRDYVVAYTNAATIISDDFKDTEDLDGVFSGLVPYKGDPINGFLATYDTKSWQYKTGEGGHLWASGAEADRSTAKPKGEAGKPAAAKPGGAPGAPSAPGAPGAAAAKPGGAPGAAGAPAVSRFTEILRSALKGPVERDETLANPRCVFQLLRRHFSRYTPEMVEEVTGCPKETFLKVAEAITRNSNPERTTAFCYAVGWTQHTHGPQVIGTCATLQLLLGNIGRPGGGILALRGHATIQGSTDIPTLYHSIQGYMSAPSVQKNHETLADYIKTEAIPTAYWANMPQFMVSYLKSVYGAAATPENDFGYAWHPRISADHSHMPMMLQMMDGKVRGMFAMGQNPAVGGQNAGLQRKALAKLEWLVVKDNFETETAAFWHNSPEVKRGDLKIEDIKTEVFFFPSAQVAEADGSFTNTQRLVQWHHKAADPPGDCRSDTWFTVHLGNRLKKLYANSELPRDQGFRNMTWDYMAEKPEEGSRIKDEPDVHKIVREYNGFHVADGRHVAGFAELKDDGSTACASWIYSGIYPAPDKLRSANRQPDPSPLTPNLNWGFSWPANRRILYNRASARPDGSPWSERKKYVYWDAGSSKWAGLDVPDFPVAKPPTAPAKPGTLGLESQSGTDAFLMKGDGKAWLFVPSGLNDGPLPTHYEPFESPVVNPLYKQQYNPVLKMWRRSDNVAVEQGDPRYPHVLTTYRLTEHHLSGVMSRWLPWLAELQPELFIEISPELAGERGIANLDFVRITTPRGAIRAKALVTRRMRPLKVTGKILHHVGLPWHWGYQGVATGDVVNDLSLLVGEPNVSIHEGKCFVCNVEKAP